MSPRLNWFFTVCFFFCSVAAMHGQQASFSESASGVGESGGNCDSYSTTNLKISCSGRWVGTNAEGYEIAVAANGFGVMGGYAYSSITVAEDNTNASDYGDLSEVVLDYLSIIGLEGEPTAILKLQFECQECILYSYPYAYYDAYAGSYGPCQIAGGIGTNSPLCILRVPITYKGPGQPNQVFLQRQLQVEAYTSVANAPAGATITTKVCVGYSAVGCSGSGATVKVSVVNGKGEVIEGVTVVGASGQVYN